MMVPIIIEYRGTKFEVVSLNLPQKYAVIYHLVESPCGESMENQRKTMGRLYFDQNGKPSHTTRCLTTINHQLDSFNMGFGKAKSWKIIQY